MSIPKMFTAIERARTTEAIASIGSIKTAFERCYLMSDGTYAACGSFTSLGIENPANAPNAHFTASDATGRWRPEGTSLDV